LFVCHVNLNLLHVCKLNAVSLELSLLLIVLWFQFQEPSSTRRKQPYVGDIEVRNILLSTGQSS